MSVGVNHGGTSPQTFGVRETLMQIVPPDFVMFQNFKHHIACIQCSNAVNSLPTPLIQHSIHYFPKVHLQRPPNHTSGGKFDICLAKTRTKLLLIMHQNNISSEKNFSGKKLSPSPSGRDTLFPNSTPPRPPSLLNSPLRSPEFQPDLRHCVQFDRSDNQPHPLFDKHIVDVTPSCHYTTFLRCVTYVHS